MWGGVGEDQICDGEGLRAIARVGAFGKHVETQLGRIPEFSFNRHHTIVAEYAWIEVRDDAPADATTGGSAGDWASDGRGQVSRSKVTQEIRRCMVTPSSGVTMTEEGEKGNIGWLGRGGRRSGMSRLRNRQRGLFNQ